MNQIDPTLRVKDIAKIFHRTPRTVRRWIADGLLRPRGYRRIGGSALELIFTGVELGEFMDRYLIRPEDLDIENPPPRGREARAAHVRRLVGTSRLLAGKASARAMAKLLRG
jgi:hypothetical protein